MAKLADLGAISRRATCLGFARISFSERYSRPVTLQRLVVLTPRTSCRPTILSWPECSRLGWPLSDASGTSSRAHPWTVKSAQSCAIERGPDFRIVAGNVEFGAAWKKTSNEGRDHLSVKLDDPSSRPRSTQPDRGRGRGRCFAYLVPADPRLTARKAPPKGGALTF